MTRVRTAVCKIARVVEYFVIVQLGPCRPKVEPWVSLKGAVDRVPRYLRLRRPKQLEKLRSHQQKCYFQQKSRAQLHNNGGPRSPE